MRSIRACIRFADQSNCAGEVIDRPAPRLRNYWKTVLDAGATDIAVYLESGGIKIVTGCEMALVSAKNDLPSP